MNTLKLFKVDYECSVLAAYICDPDSFHDFDSRIDLFTEDRATVYAEVRKLILGGNDPDLMTIVTELSGIVQASRIMFIADTPLSSNLEFHLKELDNARIRREMAQAYSKGIKLCEEGKHPDEIESEISRNVSRTEQSETENLEELAVSVMDDIANEAEGRKSLGIKCGIGPIDEATGGFEDEEVIIIAGRPGVGKTSFAMNIAQGFAENEIPGIYFTLEMSSKQITRRLMCAYGEIDSWLLFKGGLKYLYNEPDERKSYNYQIKKCSDIAAQIQTMPIMIDPTGNITIETIYRRAKKAVNVNGARWIMIDHMGLIAGWTKEGQAGKNDITRMIKVMAKDLKVPVFSLSQMNRSIESRAEPIPKMSDLRDSGSIEQDCDICMFPVPDIKPGEQAATKRQEFKTAKIYCGKNRRGETGPIEGMKWQGHYYRYSANPGFVQ